MKCTTVGYSSFHFLPAAKIHLAIDCWRRDILCLEAKQKWVRCGKELINDVEKSGLALSRPRGDKHSWIYSYTFKLNGHLFMLILSLLVIKLIYYSRLTHLRQQFFLSKGFFFLFFPLPHLVLQADLPVDCSITNLRVYFPLPIIFFY